MAIPWGPNESEDDEQPSNNVDIEAALWETQNEKNENTDTDKQQKSSSATNDDGSKNDVESCVSGGTTVADDSTSGASNSSTTTCVDRSTWLDSMKEIFGSLSAGCLAIALDFVKHSAVFKRFPDLIILVLPLAGLISNFCNSLAERLQPNDSIPSNSDQQPKPKFIDYWAPRFVLYFISIIIIGTVVFFNRRGWNAEPIDSTVNLLLVTEDAVICCFLLMGTAQVIISSLPYVWLIPVIIKTQWWATIWTELSTSPLSFIIENLIENNEIRRFAWVVIICCLSFFGYCMSVILKSKTARISFQEAKWKSVMATLLTQCFTGLLLYEASLKFEDVEILYQISTTVNDYHMTYVSNELTTNQLEGDNTPSSQIIPSCKKKGWWIALKMAGKSTTVYALMLLINLIYLWLFKTYRLNIMLLLAFYFTNTLGLICRLFVTFYGTKILKKRNRDLASWSPYLNVLGDVINMIGLRVLLFLYPLAEISLFEPV